MKKIINNKKYDTSTATIVYEPKDYVNGVKRSVYQKKTGEFFEHMETLWEGSDDKLLPLSISDAQEVLSVLLDGDAYEQLFGLCEE